MKGYRRQISYDASITQGKREYQQDRMDVRMEIVPGIHYFAVFDGHGRKHGHNISSFLADKMGEVLKLILEKNQTDLEIALAHAFETVTQFLMTHGIEQLHARHNGSTATVVLTDTVRNIMTVAYCGDSLCLCIAPAEQRVGYLTPVVHKVDTDSERERMIRMGGAVNYIHGTWRAVTEGYTLNLSRSLGDFSLAPAVSGVPMITQYNIPSCHCYIVLASDGVWDVMDERTIVEMLRIVHEGSVRLTAAMLIEAAVNLNTADNACAVLIDVSESKHR